MDDLLEEENAVGDDTLLNNGAVVNDDQEMKWSDDEEDGSGDVEMEEPRPVEPPRKAANELEAMKHGHLKILSILGPYEFYVVSKQNEKDFKTLEHSLQFHCHNQKNLIKQEQLKKDIYVIVCSSSFRKWCRARIVDLNLDKNHDLSKDLFCNSLSTVSVKVHLIDYRFNEDEIPVNHVCVGDDYFDFKSWPVKSLKCALAGFKTYPQKTLEATELMKRLATSQTHVWFLFQTIISDVTYVAISYGLRGVSVEHLGLKESLISAGLGTLDPKTDISRINYKVGKSYLEPTIPKANEVFTGVVSHTESPDRFFINRASDEKIIFKLQDDVNDFFANESKAGHFKLLHFIKGMACIARFEDDKRLYRAIIERCEDVRYKCQVRYVDYGNIGEVPFSDIFMMPDELLVNPKMCIECKLAGVEPVNHNWTPRAINRFRELLGDSAASANNQHLAVSVEYRERNSSDTKIPVSLSRWEPNQKEINVAKELINSRFASPIAGPPIGRAFTEIMNESISQVRIIRDICERHEKAQSSLRERLIPVTVTLAPSHDEIWVRNRIPAVEQLYTTFFKEMQHKMADVTTVKQEDVEIEIGRRCGFRVTEPEGSFFVRGKIIEKLDAGEDGQPMLKVLAIDFGCPYLVPRNKVYELPSQFANHEPYAFRCSLFGIKSSYGDEWTRTSINKIGEFFQDDRWKSNISLLVKEKIRNYNPDQVIKCNFVGEEHKVNLFDTESIFHSLCDMMCNEYGVALPLDRSTTYTTDSDILNDKTPIHSTEVSHRGAPDMNFNDSLYSRILQATISSDEARRYHPPTMPQEREFEGQVTNVDGKFNIFFRLIDSNRTVGAINRDISKQLVNGGLSSFNPPHDPGRACTARYGIDKSWNRAKFLGFRSGNVVDVYFVDYGNKDQLFLEEISRKVFAPNTPELAIKSTLHGVKPYDSNVHAMLCSQLYDLLVDKICVFTWENYPDQPMKVSIVEKQSGMDVKKELIRKDLLAEAVEIQSLPPDVLQVYSVLPNNRFYDNIFELIDKDYYVPVSFSAILAQNLIYLQLYGIDDPIDEQNVKIKNITDRFIRMMELLQDFSLKQNILGNQARVGDACLARWRADGRYYRGLIIRDADYYGGDITIYFVDYGNIVKVSPFSDVRELPASYANPPQPIQGLPVKMNNIKPKSGVWTPKLENKILDHLATFPYLLARFSQVSVERERSSFGLPRSIWAADMYVPSTNDPLTPSARAFDRLVSSGDLEYISDRDMLVE